MLHELLAVHATRPHCLALADEFFGLVIPVAAFLVIARAERDHSVRFRWISHDHNLGRSLTAVADHFVSHRTEAGYAHGRHSSLDHRPATQRPRARSTLATYAEIFAVGDVKGPKLLLQPIGCLIQRNE